MMVYRPAWYAQRTASLFLGLTILVVYGPILAWRGGLMPHPLRRIWDTSRFHADDVVYGAEAAALRSPHIVEHLKLVRAERSAGK